MKVIPLEEAVAEDDVVTREHPGIADRGAIKDGMWADLVIFDFRDRRRQGDVRDPFQYPGGIDTVLVNGSVVLDEGTHTNARPGKVLRRSSR